MAQEIKIMTVNIGDDNSENDDEKDYAERKEYLRHILDSNSADLAFVQETPGKRALSEEAESNGNYESVAFQMNGIVYRNDSGLDHVFGHEPVEHKNIKYRFHNKDKYITNRYCSAVFRLSRDNPESSGDEYRSGLLAISWHGPNNIALRGEPEKTEEAVKRRILREFLEKVTEKACEIQRNSKMHVSILIGGDFNLHADSAKECLQSNDLGHLEVADCPNPTRDGGPIDYFIKSKHLVMEPCKELKLDGYEEFNTHFPVVTTLDMDSVPQPEQLRLLPDLAAAQLVLDKLMRLIFTTPNAVKGLQDLRQDLEKKAKDVGLLQEQDHQEEAQDGDD